MLYWIINIYEEIFIRRKGIIYANNRIFYIFSVICHLTKTRIKGQACENGAALFYKDLSLPNQRNSKPSLQCSEIKGSYWGMSKFLIIDKHR